MVTFRPGARVKYRCIMHFDDGTREKVALPDEGVLLSHERVERCSCERCSCVEAAGRLLPLPDARL